MVHECGLAELLQRTFSPLASVQSFSTDTMCGCNFSSLEMEKKDAGNW